MKTFSFLLSLLAGLFVLSPARSQEAPFVVVEDKLGPCLIKLSVPKVWNKKVLLLAHGLRSAEAPLNADYSADKGYLKTLADQGWLIASTSYRRNGYIIGEAMEDMEDLRVHVEKTYGAPDKIYLQGTSMGAAVATLMTEASPQKYAGILTIGPALGFNRNTYSYRPTAPLLMLFNFDEAKEPTLYQKKVASDLKPALWTVQRKGHCNVTSAEILAALQALVQWSETGVAVTDKDGTLAAPVPPSTAQFADGVARAKVIRLATSKGSCDTEFTAGDLEKLGIKLGASFQLQSEAGTFKVLYGNTYADVPEKSWVAFIQAETGQLRVAVNSGDAVTPLGCRVGDLLAIGPVAAEEDKAAKASALP